MNQALLYSKHNFHTQIDADFVLENYVRLMKWKPETNETILDVGCGPGDITLQKILPVLPENFKKLIGADMSNEMVHFAKTQNNNSKVEFKHIDIVGKEIFGVLKEEEFNHIFSFYCLHWIQDQRGVLQNLYRLLKPGGDMLITFLASHPFYSIYEDMARSTKWSKYMTTIEKYISPYQNSKTAERTFQELLTETGFSTQFCKVMERNYLFPDNSVLKQFARSVNPFIKIMPESLQNDHISDFVDEGRKSKYFEYNDNSKNGDNTINVQYKLFIVVASKAL